MKPKHLTIDHRPGAVPDIHVRGGDVIFEMPLAGAHASDRLLLRCDEDGEIWVSITCDDGVDPA